ncbi:PEP-CTERM sorting domain-containing protein [Rhodoferax sp. GW822-FHT02A01]|uniref:PEP-CTERM sorting domain-containing protein n=1 Tax=Rhodoferax sp. GW822-FHT02A01 TaxID=3141537 RepID=UPI00315DDA72
MTLFFKIAAAGLMAVAGLANASVVEPFTGGQLSTPGWSVGVGADASSFVSPAPDGTSGIYLTDSTWSVNTAIDFHVGEVLSAWINPGPSADAVSGSQGGRISLGFASDSASTYALTAASDTNQLLFQSVSGIASQTPSFSDGVASTASFGNQWYKLSISWLASGITGNLYDVDGTTLLRSVNMSAPLTGNTGIALFGNGGAAVTSLAVTPVPEPESYVLLLAGLGLVASLVKRRKPQPA